MQKKRLKQLLAVVLAFAMLLTGMIPGTYGMSNVKADEVASTAEDQSIYFLNEKNEKVYMDSNNTFTLTTNDKGKFVADGVKNPYWDCKKVYVTIKDPNTGNDNKKSWYWVKEDGTFNPAVQESQTTVTLYENGEYGTQKLTFTLKITKAESPYVELKAYIGNTELSTANPYSVNVADKTSVTFKARKEGENDFSWISPDELDVHEKDANYGRYDRVNKAFIVLRDDDVAGFTVSLKSNANVKVSFSLTANIVQLKDFTVKTDKIAYIDAWNTLVGTQYVGTSYSVSYNPTNASNRDLVWEDLTPEIAEYSNDVFSNGIVPKKAGIAKFMVSSKQNPEIKHEVQIEFKYRYPLKSASVEGETFDIKPNEQKRLTITTTPSNATEQRFNWSYSEDGIVKVNDEINGSISDPTAKTTIHSLRALKEGTVTVTGTPIDDTAGCQPVVFTVRVKKGGTVVNPVDVDKIVSDGIKSAIGYMNEQNKDTSAYKYNNEWAVITRYRTGQTLDKVTLNHYYNSVAEEVSGWDELQKPTDIARVSLALSAIGADITNVKGVNLAEMMYNSPLLQKGSNELIWCLIALDATNIQIPSNARWSREKMVDALLSFQNANGGFGLYNNTTYDPDLTGMAFQALAPYKGETKVQAAIDKGLEFLVNKLTDYGYPTSETCSQVILGLSALKLDPIASGFGTEEDNIFSFFQKNYAVAEGGFSHLPQGAVNYMGTYQALEALESYRRFTAGEKSFWDMTDVEKFTPNDNSKLEPKPSTNTNTPAGTTQTKSLVKAPKATTVKKAVRTGKKIKIQWKKVKGCAGYQIWMSNKKNGKYTLVKTTKSAKATSCIIKNKKKKKVFIKVRAYKIVGKTKVYGNYSKAKQVK